MFKNIVFDMGNVLIQFNPKAYIRKKVADPKLGQLLFEEIFRSKEWVQYDRGVISLEGIAKSVQGRVSHEYHSLVESLVMSWSSELPHYPEMEELVSQLKSQGYKIYLLSNASKHFYDFRDQIPALKHFDGEFISADYQLLKPEKEIYHAFYKTFNLVPEECFFIDDLSINIEGAERTGMKGFVYHGDMNRLRGTMKKLGILKV